jgi:hypothetical protein
LTAPRSRGYSSDPARGLAHGVQKDAMQPKDITSIYQKYFDIIDEYFGSIKRYLGPEEESHIDLGLEIANYPLISDLIYDATEDIHSEIDSFWQANLKDIIKYTEEQEVLKCIYSGSISPPVLEHFVKKSALYIDTIILPDPIFNLVRLQEHLQKDNKYYLNKLIKNVFNIWKLKDLILADTKERILVILPINLELVNQNDRDKLFEASETKYASYIGSLFGEKFADRESCLKYLGQYDSSRDIFEKIRRHEILPNEFKTFDSFDSFLTNLHDTWKITDIDSATLGSSLGIYINTQFIRVQEHRFFCQRLHAEPIYDDHLPWFFFNYEMGGLDMDASIASALQQEKFEWITRVPLQVLRAFREENKLEYMRSVIRRGITDLKAHKDKDLLKVSEIIQANMQEEFRRQAAEMNELRKKASSIMKKEIPIAAGGYLAGLIPLYGFVVSLPFILRDVGRLISQKKQYERALDEKEGSFINLLMKSYEDDK